MSFDFIKCNDYCNCTTKCKENIHMFEWKMPPFIKQFDIAQGPDVDIIQHLTQKIKQLNESLLVSEKKQQVLYDRVTSEDGLSEIISILVVGLEPDEISVTTSNQRLIVQRIKHESSDKNRLCNFVYQEFLMKPDQVVESAVLKNGILTVTLRYVKSDVNYIQVTAS